MVRFGEARGAWLKTVVIGSDIADSSDFAAVLSKPAVLDVLGKKAA